MGNLVYEVSKGKSFKKEERVKAFMRSIIVKFVKV